MLSPPHSLKTIFSLGGHSFFSLDALSSSVSEDVEIRELDALASSVSTLFRCAEYKHIFGCFLMTVSLFCLLRFSSGSIVTVTGLCVITGLDTHSVSIKLHASFGFS